MRQQNAELIRRLAEAGVEYMVVGDIAAAAYGGSYCSARLDIFAPFTVENLSRLLTALRGAHPRDATRPDSSAIPDAPEHLARYRRLYLLTDLGLLDVCRELPPLGSYAAAAATARTTRVRDVACKVLGLDDLIATKESLDLPQDRLVAAELRAIRDDQRA